MIRCFCDACGRELGDGKAIYRISASNRSGDPYTRIDSELCSACFKQLESHLPSGRSRTRVSLRPAPDLPDRPTSRSTIKKAS
jgi:hypothetical protein